ncbi:MAG: shikimate kinase [Saprospiraceae bacterium]
MMFPEQNNFAVVGNPISHSLSPVIFGKYFENIADKYFYSRILGRSIEDISRLITAFDIKGMNVTAPFKKEILSLVSEKSAEVNLTEASNTIIVQEKNIKAYNTDIDGVIGALNPFSQNIKSVLILGAGGAARSAIIALQNMNIQDINIWNRTPEKAKQVAAQFNINHTETTSKDYSLIINTTPIIPNVIDIESLNKNTYILDADYNNAPFKTILETHNFNYIDGRDWVKAQGKRAYSLMTNVVNEDFNIDENAIVKKKFKNIAMLGMMGTGKSTIGKNLAEKLNWEYIDTDRLIEAKEGITIKEIFDKYGEEHFRKLESDVLQSIFSKEKQVISTGGGIILNNENISMLKENCWNILLYGSPVNLAERTSTRNRPLLEGKEKESEFQKIFDFRKNAYFRTADVLLSSDADTYINIADFIYDDFNKSFKF